MIIQKVLWGITLEWCIKPDLHGHGVVGKNVNCLVPLGVKTQIETILYVAVTAKEPRQVQLPVVSTSFSPTAPKTSTMSMHYNLSFKSMGVFVIRFALSKVVTF
jgi:hypothetical protein